MRFLFLFLVVLLVVACEEVMEVRLKDANPNVVIESVITNGKGPFLVRMTYSQSYFDQEKMEPVIDAVVTLRSGITEENLISKGSGYYLSTRIAGVPGNEYHLKVTADGKAYEASAVLPAPVPIDTIYYRQAVFNSDSLNIFVEFLDPPQVDNYYRLKLYRNKRYAPDDYYMLSDAFYDGQRIWAPFYYRDFSPGDTVTVELFNMERTAWRYLKALGETVQQSVNSQAPGNPPTNLSGGALGYFGVWSISTYETVVPEVLSVKKRD